jgi:hypothetical protein
LVGPDDTNGRVVPGRLGRSCSISRRGFPSSAPVSVTVNSIETESEIAIAIENVIVLDTVSHF